MEDGQICHEHCQTIDTQEAQYSGINMLTPTGQTLSATFPADQAFMSVHDNEKSSSKFPASKEMVSSAPTSVTNSYAQSSQNCSQKMSTKADSQVSVSSEQSLPPLAPAYEKPCCEVPVSTEKHFLFTTCDKDSSVPVSVEDVNPLPTDQPIYTSTNVSVDKNTDLMTTFTSIDEINSPILIDNVNPNSEMHILVGENLRISQSEQPNCAFLNDRHFNILAEEQVRDKHSADQVNHESEKLHTLPQNEKNDCPLSAMTTHGDPPVNFVQVLCKSTSDNEEDAVFRPVLSEQKTANPGLKNSVAVNSPNPTVPLSNSLEDGCQVLGSSEQDQCSLTSSHEKPGCKVAVITERYSLTALGDCNLWEADQPCCFTVLVDKDTDLKTEFPSSEELSNLDHTDHVPSNDHVGVKHFSTSHTTDVPALSIENHVNILADEKPRDSGDQVNHHENEELSALPPVITEEENGCPLSSMTSSGDGQVLGPESEEGSSSYPLTCQVYNEQKTPDLGLGMCINLNNLQPNVPLPKNSDDSLVIGLTVQSLISTVCTKDTYVPVPSDESLHIKLPDIEESGSLVPGNELLTINFDPDKADNDVNGTPYCSPNYLMNQKCDASVHSTLNGRNFETPLLTDEKLGDTTSIIEKEKQSKTEKENASVLLGEHLRKPIFDHQEPVCLDHPESHISSTMGNGVGGCIHESDIKELHPANLTAQQSIETQVEVSIPGTEHQDHHVFSFDEKSGSSICKEMDIEKPHVQDEETDGSAFNRLTEVHNGLDEQYIDDEEVSDTPKHCWEKLGLLLSVCELSRGSDHEELTGPDLNDHLVIPVSTYQASALVTSTVNDHGFPLPDDKQWNCLNKASEESRVQILEKLSVPDCDLPEGIVLSDEDEDQNTPLLDHQDNIYSPKSFPESDISEYCCMDPNISLSNDEKGVMQMHEVLSTEASPDENSEVSFPESNCAFSSEKFKNLLVPIGEDLGEQFTIGEGDDNEGISCEITKVPSCEYFSSPSLLLPAELLPRNSADVKATSTSVLSCVNSLDDVQPEEEPSTPEQSVSQHMLTYSNLADNTDTADKKDSVSSGKEHYVDLSIPENVKLRQLFREVDAGHFGLSLEGRFGVEKHGEENSNFVTTAASRTHVLVEYTCSDKRLIHDDQTHDRSITHASSVTTAVDNELGMKLFCENAVDGNESKSCTGMSKDVSNDGLQMHNVGDQDTAINSHRASPSQQTHSQLHIPCKSEESMPTKMDPYSSPLGCKRSARELSDFANENKTVVPSKVRILTEESNPDQAVPDCEGPNVLGELLAEDNNTFFEDAKMDVESSSKSLFNWDRADVTESIRCIRETKTNAEKHSKDVNLQESSAESAFNWDRTDVTKIIGCVRAKTDCENDNAEEGSLPVLLPLKTCSKPRRIGLSKRQRLPSLHKSFKKC